MNTLIRRIKESLLFRYYIKYKKINPNLYKNRQLLFSKKYRMNLYRQGDIISDTIAHLGYYEYETSEIVRNIARNGSVFVDAGANLGYYSLIWSSFSPNSCIYAFEPNPKVLALLKENLSQLETSIKYSLFEEALSSEVGTVSFNEGNEEQIGWGHVHEGGSHIVQCNTLDNALYSKNQIIDLLKVDIEGYEYHLLKGAEQLIRSGRIKNILMEINEDMLHANGTSKSQVYDFLKEHRYTISEIGHLNILATISQSEK